MTSDNTDYLTIALPKGKLFKPAAELLGNVGYSVDDLCENSRKLVLVNEASKLRFIITKTSDLPTYIEYGAADIGIIGKDVLVEEQRDVYELLDLGFGSCRMMVAVPASRKRSALNEYAHLRVASKYPKIAEQFFQKQGIQVEIIKLNGSIELAPMVGLSELIVDLVETGRTLKENNLMTVAEVLPVSARLIANRVSFKLKNSRISSLVEALREERQR